MPVIRILVADDHAVLRAGLRALISAQPDMEIVGEAADGREAVRRVRESHPDVAIVDLTMPEMGGIEAIRRIRKESPGTRALALTMHDDPAYARAVLAAGGSGHVVKDAEAPELLAAIRAVHRGRTFVQLGERGADAFDGIERHGSHATPAELLSPREWQVLELIAQGFTQREIGERLVVSVKTVETYRSRIGDKLGLRTRADLVRFVIELGRLGPTATRD